ncbi:hypothetical protein BDF14DRAFT_1721121 [Spinellus fusiger]|nr:hypothetical protein BDF14DRAFT_1721121 [Spinellus fusiger]
MESVHRVKSERIESLRSEVWEEWRTATKIKQNLVSYIQQHVNLFSRSNASLVFQSTSHLPLLNSYTHSSSSESSPLLRDGLV